MVSIKSKNQTALTDTLNKVKSPVIMPVKDSTKTPSLFKNHLLIKHTPTPALHITQYDYWITSMLFFLFSIFVWLYVSNTKKISQVIKGFYQTRYSNQNARNEFSVGNRISFFLAAFFIITMSIFISQLLLFYHIDIFKKNFAELGIALIIFVVYSIKFMVIKFLGNVFQVQKEMKDYTMLVFLFCNTLGLVMLPLVICLSFIKQIPPPVFIYTGIGIVITFFLIRMARGVFIGFKSSRVTKVYLFMYLCALEILPIIFLVKLVILKIK